VLRPLALALALAWSAVAQASVTTERTAHFLFTYPAERATQVAPIIEFADAELERLDRLFGGGVIGPERPPIEVIVASDDEEFRRAQPARGGIQDWMVGTAYPSLGLIVLSLAPDQFFELPDITRHEISHIALFRAAGDRHMLRWFDEGLAILTAGEGVAQRLETAAGAALTGQLLEFSALERGFPAPALQARLAYAQSALFVRWLFDRHELASKLPHALSLVRSGTPPRAALEAALGIELILLQGAWEEELRSSGSWLPIVTGTVVIWGSAGLLFLWVAMVKRRRTRLALATMRADEDEDEPWPPAPALRRPPDPVLDAPDESRPDA
jgi:hypothetical protein